MMLSQVPHRLPEILLILGAKDLGCFPVCAGGRIGEMEPSPPHAVFRLPNAQLEEKTGAVKSEGG
jgi:hypothetical protein